MGLVRSRSNFKVMYGEHRMQRALPWLWNAHPRLLSSLFYCILQPWIPTRSPQSRIHDIGRRWSIRRCHFWISKLLYNFDQLVDQCQKIKFAPDHWSLNFLAKQLIHLGSISDPGPVAVPEGRWRFPLLQLKIIVRSLKSQVEDVSTSQCGVEILGGCEGEYHSWGVGQLARNFVGHEIRGIFTADRRGYNMYTYVLAIL